jgi:hypothetical protein
MRVKTPGAGRRQGVGGKRTGGSPFRAPIPLPPPACRLTACAGPVPRSGRGKNPSRGGATRKVSQVRAIVRWSDGAIVGSRGLPCYSRRDKALRSNRAKRLALREQSRKRMDQAGGRGPLAEPSAGGGARSRASDCDVGGGSRRGSDRVVRTLRRARTPLPRRGAGKGPHERSRRYGAGNDIDSERGRANSAVRLHLRMPRTVHWTVRRSNPSVDPRATRIPLSATRRATPLRMAKYARGLHLPRAPRWMSRVRRATGQEACTRRHQQ